MHQEETYVCFNCFGDCGLIKFIKNHATSTECSYCPAKGVTPIAASVYEVSDHVIECLYKEYDDAANQLGWISSEGGYIGEKWDTPDLMWDELMVPFPNWKEYELLNAIFGDLIDNDWCKKNAYGLDDDEWAQFSWEHFSQVVMHERRFFFLDANQYPNEPESSSPREVLQTIFQYAEEMELLRRMPKGSQLFRARWEGCKARFETPKELGPPPANKATQSNRMSPAGIPMFYACDDECTALKETANGRGYFAIGRFQTLRPATILDLTSIPPVPSLFDPGSDSDMIPMRRVLKFLRHIATQVSRPINGDDRVHVDYVPTQVVTEFIRDQLTWEDSRIDGIKYSSSVRPGHVSYVLFANQGNLFLPSDSSQIGDRWLKLTAVNHVCWNGK